MSAQAKGNMPWAKAQGIVTFSFDDGYASTYAATATHLQERGWFATYNIITQYVAEAFEGLPMATWAQWKDAERMGHELASHTATHIPLAGVLNDLRRFLSGWHIVPNRLTYARHMMHTAYVLFRHMLHARPSGIHNAKSSGKSAATCARLFPRPQQRLQQWANDLAISRLQIESAVQGYTVKSFAYPAGRYNKASQKLVAKAGFKSARTLDIGLNKACGEVFRLRAVALGPDVTVHDIVIWLERALAQHAWLIVVLHLVGDHNPTSYPYFCSMTDFEWLLDRVQVLPFWVAPQGEVVRQLYNGVAK